METCTWILLVAGLVATAARLSWKGTRATWIVAAAWAAVPWLTSDFVSNVSGAKLFAWASAPDRVGGLAVVVIAEALAGGWEAMRRAGPGMDGASVPGLRGRLRTTAARVVALAPSPSLAVGLVGVQASLFHTASGWSFAALVAGMAAAAFVAVAGSASAWRFARPDPGRRAAGAVPLFAALFVVGASLTPQLDVRPKGARAAEVNLRATMFLLALATVGLALGVAVRLFRARQIRKGADAS